MNPWKVVEDFEQAIAEYTGAPYVVCVNSCTAALELALAWTKIYEKAWDEIYIPKHTYPSVPMLIKRLGYPLRFTDWDWSEHGWYRLGATRACDYACRFTSDMYCYPEYMCVSFAANKILGLEQGGAILHDNPDADLWFRRMRYDGRTPGKSYLEETFDLVGYHCPMLPSIAAQGLLRIQSIPKHNDDLVFEYPDLSQHPAFK